MSTARTLPPRTALFLPASNPRAVAKARTLHPDMVILDLEDAVRDDAKDAARAAAVQAVAEGFGHRLSAIRINGSDRSEHVADLDAVSGCAAGHVVLPKVEHPDQAAAVVAATGKPLLCMIETPRGVLAAPAIAAVRGVAGLIAGTNDLAATLGIPIGVRAAGSGRMGLMLSLQTIVLAARAHGIWALDGVFNALERPGALGDECREGRALGFDGKTLIHPNQIEIAAEAFGPTEAELEEARALIAAAGGGAERFHDRMIEAMHVDQARALIARARRPGDLV